MPLYPRKNLVPPLTDKRWYLAPPLKVTGDYEAYLQSDTPAWDTSKMVIDVKVGETYYVQAEIEGEFSIEVWENGTVNLGSFARKDMRGRYFTARYSTWEVRIVRNNQGIGYMKVNKIMVAAGSAWSEFEPYDPGMKTVKRIQKINNDMSASASHAYPYGNVLRARENVRLWKANLKVFATGTFNVVVQEFVDGVGRVGKPLFDRKMDITTLTDFAYSFDGLLLEEGKSYWVGRLSTNPELPDNVGNAAVGRSTNMEARSWRYVDALGGTSYRASTIDFTQTWYYFYGLEIEAVSMKKAVKDPVRNLIPDFNDPRWVIDDGQTGTATFNVDPTNPHRADLVIDTSAQARLISIPVKSGKTYTFQFGNITGLYRLLKGKTDSYTGIPIVGQDNKVKSFTVDDTWNGHVTLRLTHGAPGTYRFEDLQLIEGDFSTEQRFTPYEPILMKSAKLISDKNLIDIDNPKWLKRPGTTYVRKEGRRIYWDANADYAGYQIMLKDLGIEDSYLSGKMITYGGKRDITKSQVLLYYKQADGSQRYIALADYEDYRTFQLPFGVSEVRFYVQNPLGFRGETWSEDLFLNVVGETSFKSYEPNLKPAKLYTKKNFLAPFSEWAMDSAANAEIQYMKDNSIAIVFNSDTIYKGLRMTGDVTRRFDELRGKYATLSATYAMREVGASQVQIRFSGGASGITDFVLASNIGDAVAVTKYIPADFTSATVVIQTNTVNRNRIEVRDLQFEIGTVPTKYELYELVTMKPL